MELLVVIAIIGILIALLLPAVFSSEDGIHWKKMFGGKPVFQGKFLDSLNIVFWSSPDWLSVEQIKGEIQRINRSEPKAITLVVGHFFEIAWYLRGFEKFLEDIVLRPEIADFILGKVTLLCKEVAMRAVEAEVLRLIETLGANGGYVVAASNAVQPDVPVENILALYRTAREYRYTNIKT